MTRERPKISMSQAEGRSPMPLPQGISPDVAKEGFEAYGEITGETVPQDFYKTQGDELGVNPETVEQPDKFDEYDNGEAEDVSEEDNLVTAVKDIQDAPNVSPTSSISPSLISTPERRKHSVTPIKNSNGKLTGYEVVSPSGNQTFVVDADNMEMKLLHDTIIGNETDQQEVLSAYDLVFKVRSAMKAIGVKEEDLPTEPVEIAEKARLLIVKATEIQKARTEFEMENATQSFLRLYTKVMSGDKKSYNALNSDQKEQIRTFGDILMVHMLQKMGISDEDTAVAQTIVDVDRLLRERKATALTMLWEGRGMAFGNAVGGLLSSGTDHITKAVFGKEKAEGGLVGAVKETGGEIVDGLVSGTGEKIGEATEWIKSQRKPKNNQG